MGNEVLEAQELGKSLPEEQGQGKLGVSPADHALPCPGKAIPDKARKRTGTHWRRGLGTSTRDEGKWGQGLGVVSQLLATALSELRLLVAL